MSASAPSVPAAVAWHDAECGGYGADLAAWERLAAAQGGPVLDLGAGTGRVALHLAARGHEVVAVDSDPDLLAALAERAEGRVPAIETIEADVRDLDLGRRFPLIVAPMQLAHLLGGVEGRSRAWPALARHLAPEGVLGLAILSEPLPPSGTPEPMPDVREVDGWVHSSLPLAVRVGSEAIELDRLRQLVSPDGALSEELRTTRLDRLPAAALERELAIAGLEVQSSERIAATEEHVASLLLIAGGVDG